VSIAGVFQRKGEREGDWPREEMVVSRRGHVDGYIDAYVFEDFCPQGTVTSIIQPRANNLDAYAITNAPSSTNGSIASIAYRLHQSLLRFPF
jgi:hypothetical protein